MPCSHLMHLRAFQTKISIQFMLKRTRWPWSAGFLLAKKKPNLHHVSGKTTQGLGLKREKRLFLSSFLLVFD